MDGKLAAHPNIGRDKSRKIEQLPSLPNEAGGHFSSGLGKNKKKCTISGTETRAGKKALSRWLRKRLPFQKG